MFSDILCVFLMPKFRQPGPPGFKKWHVIHSGKEKHNRRPLPRSGLRQPNLQNSLRDLVVVIHSDCGGKGGGVFLGIWGYLGVFLSMF